MTVVTHPKMSKTKPQFRGASITECFRSFFGCHMGGDLLLAPGALTSWHKPPQCDKLDPGLRPLSSVCAVRRGWPNCYTTWQSISHPTQYRNCTMQAGTAGGLCGLGSARSKFGGLHSVNRYFLMPRDVGMSKMSRCRQVA